MWDTYRSKLFRQWPWRVHFISFHKKFISRKPTTLALRLWQVFTPGDGPEAQESVGSGPALEQNFMLIEVDERPFGFFGSFLFFRIILMKLPTNFSGNKTLYEHRMSLTIFESLWFSCNGLVTNLLQSFNNNFIRIESFNQRVYVTSWNSGNMLISNDTSRNSSGLYDCTFPVSQWNLKKYHDWKDMQVV